MRGSGLPTPNSRADTAARKKRPRPTRCTSALPFDSATSGKRAARNSSAGKRIVEQRRPAGARRRTPRRPAPRAAGPRPRGAAPAGSIRAATRSCRASGPGADCAIWSRISRSAAGLENSAAVIGACSASQSCSAFSARSMVGQIGHSVSSRSSVMALIFARSSMSARIAACRPLPALPAAPAHHPWPGAVHRRPAVQPGHARRADARGGAPLPRGVPGRPARGGDPARAVAAAAVRRDPAAALARSPRPSTPHLDARRLAAEGVDRAAGQAAARLAGRSRAIACAVRYAMRYGQPSIASRSSMRLRPRARPASWCSPPTRSIPAPRRRA